MKTIFGMLGLIVGALTLPVGVGIPIIVLSLMCIADDKK